MGTVPRDGNREGDAIVNGTERFRLVSDDYGLPARHQRRRKNGPAWRLVAIGATGALAAALLAALIVTNGVNPRHTPTAATASAPAAAPPGRYTFRTLDNPADPTFNLLLGINNGGVIAGAYGSGAAGHPSRGYLLLPGGQGDYVNVNFPAAVQTQVTSLNNRGILVGFWSRQNNASRFNAESGFYAVGASQFHTADFPAGFTTKPPVDQLLGVNDAGIAVGAWINAQDRSRGYEFNINTHQFTRVMVPGAPQGREAPSVVASGINDRGDICGFYVPTLGGDTIGFLKLANGTFTRIAFPAATMTKPFAVNDSGLVVGAYTINTGGKIAMHGFTWTASRGFTTIDDPLGIGATAVAGVNDAGDLVGFYTDAKGNTNGMLAVAQGRPAA